MMCVVPSWQATVLSVDSVHRYRCIIGSASLSLLFSACLFAFTSRDSRAFSPSAMLSSHWIPEELRFVLCLQPPVSAEQNHLVMNCRLFLEFEVFLFYLTDSTVFCTSFPVGF